MSIRYTYLTAAVAVIRTLEHPAVAESWDRPSALARMSVGDLAAHLARSIVLVQSYADADDPRSPVPVTAVAYFGRITDTAELDSPLNEGIRRRSRDEAAAGAQEVVTRARLAYENLASWLPGVAASRQVVAFGEQPMTIGEYLRTRLVEFAVHHDDLAVSLAPAGLPALPDAARATAVDVLVGVARWRHGDLAVLRALARRERDVDQVLRVL